MSVQDAEALLTLVAEGARRRRTAATRRNSTSSRSHALLEIATPHATLHLADLAGRYMHYKNYPSFIALPITVSLLMYASKIHLYEGQFTADTNLTK